MIDNSWAMEVPQTITTIVKTRGQARINDKFPNAYWTEEDRQNVNSIFPTIFLAYTMSEIGGDLEAQDINAIMLRAEVNVTVTKEQGVQNARFISGVVMDEFKRLRFIVQEFPQFKDNTSDLIRLIFRARRVIGQSDIINENLSDS